MKKKEKISRKRDGKSLAICFSSHRWLSTQNNISPFNGENEQQKLYRLPCAQRLDVSLKDKLVESKSFFNFHKAEKLAFASKMEARKSS